MRYICEVSFILPESMQLELSGRIRAENIVVESSTRLHDDRSARRELDRFFTCQLRLDAEHAQRVVAFRSAWMICPEGKIVEYQRAAMRLRNGAADRVLKHLIAQSSPQRHQYGPRKACSKKWNAHHAACARFVVDGEFNIRLSC